ncbi:hypothetical protein AB0J86_27270 [Micromonospora sp. NPDC049559]|uniref:hypothetical protein n=1 Tax=Micromonospora sp. NPDC049559 TaxID=3155923 RepID=UPI00342131AC
MDSRADAVAPLAPVTATLRAMFGTADLGSLPGELIVADEADWFPATDLISGVRLPELLDAAARQWGASPHAAATLAWKSYTYWLALPTVLGWASARRVPLVRPEEVLVRLGGPGPLLSLGLRRSITVAVLPSDPLALAGRPDVRVVADERALLAALRTAMLDEHLTPLLDAIHARVRVGARTLLGSVASGVAYGVLRAADALPGSAVASVDALLDALDVADLIELVPGPNGEPTVQRKTCCLAFTLPRPKVCSGCCLRQD